MRHLIVVAVVVCWLLPGVADARLAPGAAGIGDPYYPRAGNGGYDVAHYGLDLAYTPRTNVLRGVATIRATATQPLSRFNLDLVGLRVSAVTVDGRPAQSSREPGELIVTPPAELPQGAEFTTVVTYSGVPRTLGKLKQGTISGFIHTDDGALVAGQPEGASTWFPANDHPLDKAAFSFRITVPRGLEAIANGVLAGVERSGSKAVWKWELAEPMAPYLATATIGQFQLRSRTVDGIRYWDAIDPDLLKRPRPHSGRRFAMTGVGQPSYQRLRRLIDVPAGGSELSFWVRRDTEPEVDFFFVEAQVAGSGRWTTLRDLNRHTARSTGVLCPYWLEVHPFLERYISERAGDSCRPRGRTGAWWAASGESEGYERWVVDLSPYAGRRLEVSLSYANDAILQLGGIYVDDIKVAGTRGSASFEHGLSGWKVTGAPRGSHRNPKDWHAGTAASAPPTTGQIARKALDRQPEILRFLAGLFGPYPFSAAGSIVDDFKGLSFALENQTRPVYSRAFFDDRVAGVASDAVVAHELAHQWVGDHVSVTGWRDTWLNEGFATYAEWLWGEHKERGSVQQRFNLNARREARSDFWDLRIGDPGKKNAFASPVYDRGAMTLHALRKEIGDAPFRTLLRTWIAEHAGGNVTTDQFIALTERIAGRELDGFFTTWLFTGSKPPGITPGA